MNKTPLLLPLFPLSFSNSTWLRKEQLEIRDDPAVKDKTLKSIDSTTGAFVLHGHPREWGIYFFKPTENLHYEKSAF
jgi:hypothetical protein